MKGNPDFLQQNYYFRQKILLTSQYLIYINSFIDFQKLVEILVKLHAQINSKLHAIFIMPKPNVCMYVCMYVSLFHCQPNQQSWSPPGDRYNKKY